MEIIKIGLIKEGKNPPDKRVAFTPAQVQEIHQLFPSVRIVIQSSESRCFKDLEYKLVGAEIVSSVEDCDILFGIKEVPIDQLVPNKTYLFFSHTIKKQPYNRKLLQTILQRNITLIDYEALKDSQGNRLVAFGRYAGIVGAYNALWTFGKKYNTFHLRRAFECFDINDLKIELRKVTLPPIKIVLTGGGRVAKGAMETLDTAGIRKVSTEDFLAKEYNEAVYVQLSSADYNKHKAGLPFNRTDFHLTPERYDSDFAKYGAVADILIAGAYWNPKAPKLFEQSQWNTKNFKIRIIADITCDINGSIPSTKKASTITEPLYDYKLGDDTICEPFGHQENITVMAIDNLPCELPRSSSDEFGRDLIDRIMNPLIYSKPEGIATRATVAKAGKLTTNFEYLIDYVNDHA
jgi:saccharopine dehydrogenase (NAD+, L-lysine forming)